MNLTQFKEQLFARGKELGFADMEVYYASKERFNASIFKGEIDKYSIAVEGGLSFRGLYNGKMGYAYTELVDESSIEMLLQGALAGAQVIDSDEVTPLFAGSPSYPEVNLLNATLDEASPEEKIAVLKEFEAECYRLDSRVVNVNYCQVETQHGERMIANTKGLACEEKGNAGYVVGMVVVKQGDDNKTAFQFQMVEDFRKVDAKALAKKAVDEAVSMLGAEPVESRTYPVLLRHDVAASMLATFAGIFFAANAQKGRSLLNKSKVGQKIASDVVTIVDDPLMAGGLASRAFDAEGVASRKLAIVEKGVFNTLLYNQKTALVDGVESTGHGSRGSYKGAIATAFSNLYVEPGTRSLQEMAEAMGEGVIITDVQGLHSGANAISGDFSLGANGYYVQGGKIQRPVNQITVAGNFYEVLNSVVEVGSDIEFSPMMGYVGSPTLWVKGLAIAGK